MDDCETYGGNTIPKFVHRRRSAKGALVVVVRLNQRGHLVILSSYVAIDVDRSHVHWGSMDDGATAGRGAEAHRRRRSGRAGVKLWKDRKCSPSRVDEVFSPTSWSRNTRNPRDYSRDSCPSPTI
jgi:hypothetical protein